jgi:hypothetical protein
MPEKYRAAVVLVIWKDLPTKRQPTRLDELKSGARLRLTRSAEDANTAIRIDVSTPASKRSFDDEGDN